MLSISNNLMSSDRIRLYGYRDHALSKGVKMMLGLLREPELRLSSTNERGVCIANIE